MDSPCLSAAGLCFLRLPTPAAELARSCDWVTGESRPQRGYHVSHRHETLGELASLRREQGTVLARPLTLTNQNSLKDVSVTCVPLTHYGVSPKASRVFNSVPTFPRIDFGCDYLLSSCFYGLLKTPRLLTTPRPYGNRHVVLARSNRLLTSFRV